MFLPVSCALRSVCLLLYDSRDRGGGLLVGRRWPFLALGGGLARHYVMHDASKGAGVPFPREPQSNHDVLNLELVEERRGEVICRIPLDHILAHQLPRHHVKQLNEVAFSGAILGESGDARQERPPVPVRGRICFEHRHHARRLHLRFRGQEREYFRVGLLTQHGRGLVLHASASSSSSSTSLWC